MKLYISTGNSRMEKKWNGQEMEFSVFLERLSHTVRTSETMEQYRKMSKRQMYRRRMHRSRVTGI